MGVTYGEGLRFRLMGVSDGVYSEYYAAFFSL